MFSISLRRWVSPSLGLFALVLLGSASPAHSDAIGALVAMPATSVVEVFINKGEIRVELETGVPDLVVFNGIFPDDFRVRMGLESEPEEDLRNRFFNEVFVIRADDGPPLPGRLVSFETRRRTSRDEITGEPLPAAEGEGQPVVFVVFSYVFKGEPKTLTLIPPNAGGDSRSATIDLMTYHKGLPVMEYHAFSSEETIDLDWEDSWFSRFRNGGLRRRYDSPLNVFFYVEPFEVRVEVIARLRDLGPWIGCGIEGLETIPLTLQADVKQKAADLLARDFDLAVDGEVVSPVLDRAEFLERRLRTTSVIAPPRELTADSAILRAIFLQPTTGYPHEATVTWKLFPERVERISGAVTDAAGSLPVVLQPGGNELCWQTSFEDQLPPTMVDVWPVPSAFGRVAMWVSWFALAVVAVLLLGFGARAAGGGVPWASVGVLALAAAGLATGSWTATRSALIDEARASEVVSALLNNVYRAFDAHDERTVRKILGRSVSDELLTEVSDEIRRGLTLAGEGGVRAGAAEVDLENLTLLDSDGGIAARTTWVVTATVGHWGHIHHRRTRSSAEIRIDEIEGVWKITALELIDEQRLGSARPSRR